MTILVDKVLMFLGFINLVTELPQEELWQQFIQFGAEEVTDDVYFENLRMKVYFLERMVSEEINLHQIGSISRETIRGWIKSEPRPISRYISISW
jgi:hypothetical protein